MAETADGRIYKRKRIKDPTDENNYIDVPVLYQCQFKTMQEQAQESVLYFNNSSTSSRKVHTRRITNPNDGSYLDVERIDEWYTKIAAEQAQEYAHILKNIDPPPIQPNGDNSPSHERTHIVRYFPGNVGGPDQKFIDIEYIDELKSVDATSQYQEWILYARHPELGDQIIDPNVSYEVTQGYCDPAYELAPDESALGIDPPWRLDPLSNIVNVKWTTELPTGGTGELAIYFYDNTTWFPEETPWRVWQPYYVGDTEPENIGDESHYLAGTEEITFEQYDNLVGGGGGWPKINPATGAFWNLADYFPELDEIHAKWVSDYSNYLLNPELPSPKMPVIACYFATA